MNFKIPLYLTLRVVLLVPVLSGCEAFTDVDVPNDRITSLSVFSDDATAFKAMDGVYIQLFNTSFAAGGTESVSFLAGLSADTFRVSSPVPVMEAFAAHEIDAVNSYNLSLWSGAYATIYMCNSILEQSRETGPLRTETLTALQGESLFIRAFTYFYLTSLYGAVPLIASTSYSRNALVARTDSQLVYDQLTGDLLEAVSLLNTDYRDGKRTHVNRYTAMALLARVYLYEGNWELAEQYSSAVLEATGVYTLASDLDSVFLSSSTEALWQVSPEGWGGEFTHTREGNLFIRISESGSPVQLADSFMAQWEASDLRREHWVGQYSSATAAYYYPFKYKVQYDASGGTYSEYSMVMRLAEQYLIRAEARAHRDNLQGALDDVNRIRERAGLPALTASSLSTQPLLLEAIAQERRMELFSEWGHRWLDLKRTGQVPEREAPYSETWEATDYLYPIPDAERMKNPNLTQNEGY